LVETIDRKVKEMNALEHLFGRLFVDKLPPLSPTVKEWVVKILPWVLIVLGALGLLMWLGTIGLFGAAQTAAIGLQHYAASFLTVLILYILIPLLQLTAIAGGYLMLSRKRLGWLIAFYSLLLGLIVHILYISLIGIILDLVFAYLLFQIRPYYREF
jgi:hypothetical protein